MLKKAVIAFFLLTIVCGGGAWWLSHNHPDALRRIVLDQCVANARVHHSPQPCQYVDADAGYALLKDRNGPLQYLLLPTIELSGIESPLLLNPATTNYFADAWQSREVLSQRFGQRIPDSALSLAINSQFGRSQNQLHIHISCLRPEVRALLDRYTSTLSRSWAPFPEPLNRNRYLALTLTAQELRSVSPFIRLYREYPAAREHMGRFSLLVAQVGDGSFILLATERNLPVLNFAHAEELQDHECGLLKGSGSK